MEMNERMNDQKNKRNTLLKLPGTCSVLFIISQKNVTLVYFI